MLVAKFREIKDGSDTQMKTTYFEFKPAMVFANYHLWSPGMTLSLFFFFFPPGGRA